MQPPRPAGRTGPGPDAVPSDDLRASASEERSADDTALAEAKSMLRKAIRQRRAARSDTDRRAADHARAERVLEFLGDVDGLRIACYLSVGDEPSTLEIIGALQARGARILLPALGKRDDGTPRRDPDWAWYAGPDALRTGLWGIPEPTTPPLGAEGLAKAEVILCSGLAGSPTGDRLGVGGGWYDRARAYADPGTPVVLLVNDDEVLPALPMQDWDRPVDVVITQERTLGTGGGSR
ncbi:5-formyltetrahydrofolate cyclo-ligase [Mariniluteicoccus flavus]